MGLMGLKHIETTYLGGVYMGFRWELTMKKRDLTNES